ncbi:hypothetical protein DFJ43DRAFT_1175994 [Lentinula guzmanii]|uniref:Uncharacterized protein n=1 Tax=Lentinula guzmanii TaxID=2804957 RepID=A0AA38JEG4_9AGAR|nr:hypothetical protein DFJ43DRAFT_1175994 [Lentinula guzmanii]
MIFIPCFIATLMPHSFLSLFLSFLFMFRAGHLCLVFSISFLSLIVSAVRVKLNEEGVSSRTLTAPLQVTGSFQIEPDDPSNIVYNVVNTSNHANQVIQTEFAPDDEICGSFPVFLDKPGVFELQAYAGGDRNNILATSNSIVVVAPDVNGGDSQSSGSFSSTHRTQFPLTSISSSIASSESHLPSPRSAITSIMRTYPSNTHWSFDSNTVPLPTSGTSSQSTPTTSSTESPNLAGNNSKARHQHLVDGIVGGLIGLFMLLILSFCLARFVRRRQNNPSHRFWDGDGDGGTKIARIRHFWSAMRVDSNHAQSSSSIIPFTQAAVVSQTGPVSDKTVTLNSGYAATAIPLGSVIRHTNGSNDDDIEAGISKSRPTRDGSEDGSRSIEQNRDRGTVNATSGNGTLTSGLIVGATITMITSGEMLCLVFWYRSNLFHAGDYVSPPFSERTTPPPSYRSATKAVLET